MSILFASLSPRSAFARILAVVLAGFLTSLVPATAAKAPRKNVVAVPAPVPPVMQLGDAVKPLAYEAELTIVPTRDRFSGHLVVHVDIARPTDFFWMNANRLEIRSATLAVGGKTYVAKTSAGGRDFVGLRLPLVVPAGRAVLTFDYDGAIDRTETLGVFRQPDAGNWYVFTQFENTEARRAFPSFDEPGWKTPWHLTLVVPASDVAASNTPIVSEEPIAPVAVPVEPVARKGKTAPVAVAPAPPAIPMKRVRFAPTPPLPSYLVAFAVGPFDVVDGGRAGKKGIPLRYLVPKGHAGEVAYAKDTVPKLLDLLEDYFGQPYPYDKLDSVAIPVTIGFGAMENVGLITYNMNILLSRPDAESDSFRRDLAGTAAHEMAHQWFGDFVTMQWWNDVWLNESFASWMAYKTVDRFAPKWQIALDDDSRRHAIDLDRLTTTRQIRQPINTMDDLANAFDSITYSKGKAVLSMFENAIGEERFRNGVRRYLYEHANGNARAEDFFGAIAAEAGADGPLTVGGLKSFVEQPGVPRLTVALDCGPDGKGLPKLLVGQSRYLPARPTGDQSVAQRWTFPACFQFGRGGDFNEMCSEIQEKQASIPLPSGEGCPQWVLPNRGGAGYFVPTLSPELMQQLVHAPLLPSEAVPALVDATTLANSGEWPADLALDFAARFATNRQSPVVLTAMKLAQTTRPGALEDGADRDGFARYVQKNFAVRARALGWTPKSSDRDGDAALRAELLPWVADMGNDAGLRKDAQRLAREWIAGRTLPVGAAPVLTTAAWLAQGQGGKQLLDAYVDALGRMTGGDRRALVGALGSFRDPVLAEGAYDALFSERIDAREGINALRTGAELDDAAATAAIAYLKTHYDAIARRLPDNAGPQVMRFAGTICDAVGKADFEATFADRAPRITGGTRLYAQKLETINICLAGRQAQRATLKTYLAKP